VTALPATYPFLNPNSEVGEHTRPRVSPDAPSLPARTGAKAPEPLEQSFTHPVFREGAENSTRGRGRSPSTSEFRLKVHHPAQARLVAKRQLGNAAKLFNPTIQRVKSCITIRARLNCSTLGRLECTLRSGKIIQFSECG